MTASDIRRFVILHHTGYGREHWDLMIEQDDSLATWKLYHHPASLPNKDLELFRIGDHRKMYLDYEGPLTGERGEVACFRRGEAEVLEKNSQRWRVRLTSEQLSGEFELTLVENDRWRIEIA